MLHNIVVKYSTVEYNRVLKFTAERNKKENWKPDAGAADDITGAADDITGKHQGRENPDLAGGTTTCATPSDEARRKRRMSKGWKKGEGKQEQKQK